MQHQKRELLRAGEFRGENCRWSGAGCKSDSCVSSMVLGAEVTAMDGWGLGVEVIAVKEEGVLGAKVRAVVRDAEMSCGQGHRGGLWTGTQRSAVDRDAEVGCGWEVQW